MGFIEQQQEFMDYIKNPQNPLPDGIEARRMKIYRELFFNNVDGFVSSAFPVLKSLYSEDDWRQLVQCFFETHDCQTPIFVEIAGEFITFLQTQYQPTDSDPVFMLELAHYEWLELVVAVAQKGEHQQALLIEDLSSAPLLLAATARVAQYQFDVQHISVDYQPIEPPQQPQYFCVYLDEHEEVAFLQLNPLSAQVLAYIDCSNQGGVTFNSLIVWLEGLYPQMDSNTLYSGCEQLMQQLVTKGIIVTSRAE